MGELAVEVTGLAKRYQVGLNSHTTLREMLAGAVRRRKEQEPDGMRELWALDGVDFTLETGEVVGIIGRNGAGKSTLLKVLARITEPTRGEARVRGRLASLLEVGTGFHEELTGRENVYLNGVVLGMGRREIDRRFDEIVEFSGISGRFLDMQIKRYSSGMKLRLAFAVASHLETEVVVVDEVLAVGDAEFQRRCLQKMRELRESGRTILFVSHDIGTVAQLCPRCIWLAQGKVLQDGPAQAVIDAYQASFGAAGIRSTIAGETFGQVRIDRAEMVAPGGGRVERLRRADPFAIEVDYTVLEPIEFFDAAFYIEDSRGVRVFDEALHETVSGTAALGAPGRHRLALDVDLPLAAKEYALSLWIGGGGQTFIEEPIMRFEVEPALEDRDRETRKSRMLHGTGTWRTEHLDD